jgi:hypothetical protein
MVGRWFYLLVVAIGVIAYVNAPGSDAARTTVEQACASADAASVAVTIDWPAPDDGATALVLDVGIAPEFGEGTFRAHGPFAPEAGAQTLELPARLEFHFRLNAQHADEWRTVADGSFETACPEES